MSLTDSISVDVQAMTTGVNRAWQEAAAVDHAVEQIAARARAPGFIGITTGLTRVRELIGQVRSRLTEATDVLGEASGAVNTVARQPSPQETIAALIPVVAALTTVESSLIAAAAAIDEARRLITTALQGGEPGRTLTRLQQMLQILAAVRARGTTARQHVDAALAQARQVGDWENRSWAETTPADHPSHPRRPTTRHNDKISEVAPARRAGHRRRMSHGRSVPTGRESTWTPCPQACVKPSAVSRRAPPIPPDQPSACSTVRKSTLGVATGPSPPT